MKTEKIDVLLGLQWGDEGKGKVVDVLTPRYDVVARFQGGPNAGHTLIFDNKKFVLKSIPSGVFQGNKQNIIGNGMVLDAALFKAEAEALEAAGAHIQEGTSDTAYTPSYGQCTGGIKGIQQGWYHRSWNRPHIHRQGGPYRRARR